MARDHEVLDDLREQAATLFKAEGIDNQLALTIAYKLREHLRGHWGGQSIYFTKSKDLSDRDQAIFERFNGKNMLELIREYDISEQLFYKIIKRVRAEYISRTQIDLF